MYLQTASRVLILPLALGVSMLATAQDSSAQGATSTGGSAQSSQSDSKAGAVAQADKSFVMKAAQGGMAEVELGNLAKEKAQSDQVKQFAQRMVDDHGKANEELKSIAQQKGITLPTSLPAKEQKTKDKLSSLSGEQFDHAYVQHMLMDHKKDAAEFKKASTTCKDNDIKEFVGKTLPTLQDHLKEAQQIGVPSSKTAGMNKSKEQSAASNQQ